MAATSITSEHTQVTTTIRYDPGLLASQISLDSFTNKFKCMSDFYLLAFHQDKMMNSAKHLNWPVNVIELYSGDRGLQVLFAKLLLHVHEGHRADGPLQIRLTLKKDGKLEIISSPALRPGLLFPFTPLDENKGPTLEAWGGLYQRIPVQVRIHEIPAFARACTTPANFNFEQASSAQERLIVSHYGEILQGEFTTPYFSRDGNWVTPAFSGGPTDSVTRRYALVHGLCKEGIILKSSLRHGDECWLSDDVRGFFRGSILLPSQLTTSALSTGPDDAASIVRASNTGSQGHDASLIQHVRELHANRTPNAIPKQEEPEEEEDDLIIVGSTEPDRKPQTSKRPNPFPSSSPCTRRSSRFQPDFVPQCLADDDEASLPRDYEPVPNPEQRRVLDGRRTPQPY